MSNRLLACAEIKKRISDARVSIGLLTFVHTATEVAKEEEMPICFMSEGVDSIIKYSSRTSSATRKGQGPTRSLEIILELVAHKDDDVYGMCKKVRNVVLSDPHPVKDVNGRIDPTTFMVENRTEGPVGYGIPNIEAMMFVITLVYVDEP